MVVDFYTAIYKMSHNENCIRVIWKCDLIVSFFRTWFQRLIFPWRSNISLFYDLFFFCRIWTADWRKKRTNAKNSVPC
jgi:hypothetical protein